MTTSLAARLSAMLRTMGARGSFVRLIAIAALIVIVFSVLRPSVFLSTSNLQFLALSTPELALLSLAISLTMLTGGIDLSVVAIANVAGVAAALVMVSSDGSIGGVLLGCLCGMAAAAVCGLINAFLVAVLRVTPILATLGTSQLFGGIALVLTGGTVIKGLPDDFTRIATSTLAGVPLIFLLMMFIAVLVAVLLTRTALGFRMRLLGANPLAAQFSGVATARVLLATYVFSGTLAGIAGLVISSRASGANSEYGTSYILLGIVVAVLAGVNPDGGYITVAGVIIATLTLQLLSTGLLGVNVNAHVVNIAQGLLLVGMMALNTYGGRALRMIRARRRPRVAPGSVA
jgi:simple sugar transport system permease protein